MKQLQFFILTLLFVSFTLHAESGASRKNVYYDIQNDIQKAKKDDEIWVNDQTSQYGGIKPISSESAFSNNKINFFGDTVQNYNVATPLIHGCIFGKDIANTLRFRISVNNNKNSYIYKNESSTVATTSSQDNYNDSILTKTLNDEDFSVTIIGSGTPKYNPERSQPSALVQYKGMKFLVDMGNGTKTQLEKLGLTGRNSPDALFITHHHIDHNDEFISMVHSKFMSENEFLIAGPSPINEMIDYVKKFYKDDLNYRKVNRGRTFNENNTNETVKVLKGGESFEYKDVKISTLKVPHSIQTIAYRFDANGKSIVITGDLTYTNDLQKLAKDVDVLVIDGKTISNRNSNKSSKNQKGMKRKSDTSKVSAHASIEDIAKMAVESKAKTMVLTHLGNRSTNNEETIKRYSDLGYKGNVIIAEDFLTITPNGESFILQDQTTFNNSNKRETGNTSNRNSVSGNKQIKKAGQYSGKPGNPIERFDTNDDNKISYSEAKGRLKENFKKIDTNCDQFITREELQKRRKAKQIKHR